MPLRGGTELQASSIIGTPRTWWAIFFIAANIGAVFSFGADATRGQASPPGALIITKAGFTKSYLAGIAETVFVTELVFVTVQITVAGVVARDTAMILEIADLTFRADVALVYLAIAIVVETVTVFICSRIHIAVGVVAVRYGVHEGT